MRKLLLLPLVLLTLCSAPVVYGQLGYYPPETPPPVLIRAGRLLDVRSGKYLQNQAILTEAGRIKEIGSYDQVEPRAPKGVVKIDLSRATVLPGLIDCHAHLVSSMEGRLSGGENITIAIAESSQSLRALMGAPLRLVPGRQRKPAHLH